MNDTIFINGREYIHPDRQEKFDHPDKEIILPSVRVCLDDVESGLKEPDNFMRVTEEIAKKNDLVSVVKKIPFIAFTEEGGRFFRNWYAKKYDEMKKAKEKLKREESGMSVYILDGVSYFLMSDVLKKCKSSSVSCSNLLSRSPALNAVLNNGNHIRIYGRITPEGISLGGQKTYYITEEGANIVTDHIKKTTKHKSNKLVASPSVSVLPDSMGQMLNTMNDLSRAFRKEAEISRNLINTLVSREEETQSRMEILELSIKRLTEQVNELKNSFL